MSKMTEMAQTIEELHTAATSINAAAIWLYQQFSGDDEAQPAEAPAKEEPKMELKLYDVRAVLAEKSRAGHTAEVRALLKKYGAAKLSAVDPASYEALLKDAEVIGNGSQGTRDPVRIQLRQAAALPSIGETLRNL